MSYCKLQWTQQIAQELRMDRVPTQRWRRRYIDPQILCRRDQSDSLANHQGTTNTWTTLHPDLRHLR
jgi:hypothetical protein